jgi:ATP-dependent Lon protease
MAELRKDKERLLPDILAVLPLRGTVLFPQAVMPLGAGRASSVRLIEEAVQAGRLVGTVAQRDASEDAPTRAGLHDVGTAAVIHKALKQPDGSLRIVAQGLGRFRIVELVQTEPYLKARIEAVGEDEPDDDVELQALARSVTSLFESVVAF